MFNEAQRQAELSSALAIVNRARAEARGLTSTERTTVDNHMSKAAEIRAKATAAAADAPMWKALGDAMKADHEFETGTSSSSSFGGKNVLPPDRWAKHAADALTKANGQYGAKAVVSGSLTLPAVTVDAVGMAQEATSFLALMGVRAIAENSFSYIRQSVRTSNAAPVADLALKPTSVFTFVEVPGKAEVIAHLSEPIPERFLEDHEDVIQILRDEMGYGVVREMEDQALNGTGVSPSWPGLNTVSGTLSQAFATDVPTTLRKAYTALQVTGEKPSAFVLNPVDLEALGLLRADGATGQYLDLAPTFATISGSAVPAMVVSTAVTAGTAWLGDWSFARLYVRENLTLKMDASGSLFDSDAIKFRAEQRANVAYVRPSAFIKIDLTSA